MASSEYMQKKRKMEYELYLQSMPEIKVRAFVKYNGKYYCLMEDGHPRLAGGNMEAGEDKETAIIREIGEEMHARATVSKFLGSFTYKKELMYDNKKFILDREENFFLCEASSFEDGVVGLKGEFEDGTKVISMTALDIFNSLIEREKNSYVKKGLLRIMQTNKKRLL